MYLRAEEPTLARQNSDVNIFSFGNFVHRPRELVVGFSAQRVELLGCVECDEGHFAAVFGEDLRLCHYD
jgi:hypothetical protein